MNEKRYEPQIETEIKEIKTNKSQEKSKGKVKKALAASLAAGTLALSSSGIGEARMPREVQKIEQSQEFKQRERAQTKEEKERERLIELLDQELDPHGYDEVFVDNVLRRSDAPLIIELMAQSDLFDAFTLAERAKRTNKPWSSQIYHRLYEITLEKGDTKLLSFIELYPEVQQKRMLEVFADKEPNDVLRILIERHKEKIKDWKPIIEKAINASTKDLSSAIGVIGHSLYILPSEYEEYAINVFAEKRPDAILWFFEPVRAGEEQWSVPMWRKEAVRKLVEKIKNPSLRTHMLADIKRMEEESSQ